VKISSTLQTLWHEPRRSSLRFWIFQIHQWAGVGAGLYLALMGLTGSLSVFLPELRGILVAPVSATSNEKRLSLQALQDRIEATSPGLRLRAVFPGNRPTQPDTFQEQATDKSVREFVLNPYNGQILVVRRKGDTFYDWVRDLHANLLNGKTGKTINGFGGILLFLTAMSGLVVWWPGKRHVHRRRFQVATSKGLSRFSYDLHRIVGLIFIVPISVAAATGIGLAFPQTAGIAVSYALGPLSGAPAPVVATKKKVTGKQSPPSLDDVVRIAREAVPGATPVRILAPGEKAPGFLVSMHLPADWRDEGDNRVTIEAGSAKLLAVQLGSGLSLSSRIIEAVSAVHFGQYGGITTRFLACLLGISLPLLHLTGMVMWWKRVIARRNRTTPPVMTIIQNSREALHATATQ